ncbi:WD40-like protein [Leptospira broomii serovar Hurstbridge str. 5399]|uniref:WD40-like protein n=1 Tax=Leptospira broomii serovar Hurstbridge str. 5399 TaxID=1049789 RepID=T0FC01_9LEPT|nr:PD40 domain-containing protein [Leptospira broomii]EQA45411.1 WD40-like protein [Leptospira broomii serovar Hurstbridge str. 5399]
MCYSKYVIFLFVIFLFGDCTLLSVVEKIKPIEFDYGPISRNYFRPDNEKPFPLTVQRGNNLYHSTTKDGRYLFYTTGQKGNFDVWFRDLKSSIVVPVTRHPSSEYKPAISPDGSKLVFVSEQYDSAGDIVLLAMNPAEWAAKILDGKRFLSEDFIFLTNSEYTNSLKSDRFVDTDPIWAPDNRHIVFSSDRLSPGTPNLILWDTKGAARAKLLTKNGAASPFWSEDGKRIVYISYSESPRGELYSIEVATGTITRITKDDYLDFSPSFSPDSKFIYYTSIRRDSDNNGKIDERDNSVIVRLDLSKGREALLTSGNFSLFDTRYSRFNGGSILFTASFYETMNIYFLPENGSVPKAKNIGAQFDLALQYKQKQGFEDFILAIDSLDSYFSDDPLFPIFKAKGLLEKYKESKRKGKLQVLAEVRKEMTSNRLHPDAGLSFAFLLEADGAAPNALRDYSATWEKVPKINRNALAALEEEIGDAYINRNDRASALRVFESLRVKFPDYYHDRDVLRKIGTLRFGVSESSGWILPNSLLLVANNPKSDMEDLRNIYELLESEMVSDRSDAEKISIADTAENANSLQVKSAVLHRFFSYIKALGLKGQGDFKQSNSILDGFLEQLKPEDPLFLKTHILKSENFRGLGDTRNSLTELRIFLENYDAASGVAIDEKEMERSFLYFENLARNYENRSDFLQASFHYFFNAENMFLAKSKNLFLDTLYKDYAIYYQRLMVDTSFKLAKSISDKNAKGLLGTLNPVEFDPLDKKEGLFYVTQYYEKEKILPRARTFLDLATLYGYAYYLINRSVIRETYFYAAGTMDAAKKEAALRDFKQAEYELRWIIFSDPTYHDAYQLLGWLYQYVDIMKSRKPPDAELSDEDQYASIYRKYFPEKNFEENVELYSQILELLGENFANKKALSDLRLNLGNNYFLLKNYPKADEQYSLVESYSKFILSKAQFEDYRQKAVFLFNSARSSIYMSRYGDAIRKLNAASDLYSKNEFSKLYSQADPRGAIESYHEKLALIYTLTGLSHMESGEYSSAIPFYKDALKLNDSSRLVDPVNLHNALALCFQKIGSLSESEENLRKAEQLVKEKGVNWFPRKVKITFWDYFWDLVFDTVLPDSTRISGSGRFPEAIPTAYQPLLSSGIRINNLLLEQNYELAGEETDKRLAYVNGKGLNGSFPGKLIKSQSWNDLGFVKYKRNEFEQAKAAFRSGKSYEASTSEISFKSQSTFRRYLYSLFAEIEAEDKNSKFHPEVELEEAYGFLYDMKTNYIDSCLSISEDQDRVSLRKRCEEAFYKENYDYDILISNLFYYLGEEEIKRKDWISGFEKLGLAVSLLEDPSGLPKEIIGLAQDPFSKKERVIHSLSRASIYFRLGDLERAYLCLNFAEEMANEFFYANELIQTWVLQARLDIISGKSSRAKERLLKAESLLQKQAHIIPEVKGFLLRDLYETKIRYEMESGNQTAAFKTWDRYRSVLLFRNFEKGTWEFEGNPKEYLQFETSWKYFRTAYLKYQAALERRVEIREAESELNTVSASAMQSLEQLRKVFPNRVAFLSPFRESADQHLGSQESEFRIIKVMGKNFVRIRKTESVRFVTVLGDEEEVFTELSRQPEWMMPKKIFDPGNTNYAGLFARRIEGLILKTDLDLPPERAETSPRTVTSYLDLSSKLKVRNIKTGFLAHLLDDSDIIVSSLPEVEGDFLFGERVPDRLDLKEIFSKRHKISSVIFVTPKQVSWKKISKVASASIGSGVDKVFFCDDSKDCITNVLAEIDGQKIAQGVYRFGRISLKRESNKVRAESLFAESRSLEIIGNYRAAYDKIYEAKNYAQTGSDFSRRIEENLLRLLRRNHSKLSLDEILSLSYETRNGSLLEELNFTLCLAAILDHDELDCSDRPLPADKKNLISAVSALKQGQDPKTNFDELVGIGTYEPFLLRIRLAELALESYFPDLVKEQLIKAAKIARGPESLSLVSKLSEDLSEQTALLEEISEPKRGTVIASNSENPQEENLRYKKRLLDLADRKSFGGRISPIALYSEVLGASRELFSSLTSSERAVIADLLRYSIGDETAGEMSDFLSSYIEFERGKGNLPRVVRFMIEVSRAYYSKGDYENAQKWILKAESEPGHFQDWEIEYLKYKVNVLNGKPQTIASDSPFFQFTKFYQESLSSTPKNFLDIANRWVSSRKRTSLTPRERRELNDFLVFLQTLAFKKNDSEVFFDLCVAKDKVSVARKTILGKEPFFSDIPKFEPVSLRLEEKLPADQEFLAVADLGLTTFYIKFTKGKSNGNIAYKDNRKLKATIKRYHEEAEKGGSEILLRESLETEYRQNIRISKNKTTYLYLSNYHFLVPLVPRSEEEIYYVTDPLAFLENPIHQEKDEFLPGFTIIAREPNFAPDWYKRLLKLDALELGTKVGRSGISPFFLIQEPLELDFNRGVLFGRKPLPEISDTKQKGSWMLSSSFLKEFDFGSENLRDSLYFLQKSVRGSGIVNLGFQTDTHNSRFLKELTRREDSRISLRNRFLRAIEIMRDVYPFDKYWNGYRLFATSIISK